jgi:GNAT superfamily N-acetyltransferase
VTLGSASRTAKPVRVRTVRAGDEVEVLRMRRALWPHHAEAEQRRDIEAYVAGRHDAVLLVAERPAGGLCGFAELALRSYAEDCRPGPRGVGFLEGWWVDADRRRDGVGRALVDAGERWARELGCLDLGSDALLGNELGRAAHLALGFEEVGRAMQFRKPVVEPLGDDADDAPEPPRTTVGRGSIAGGVPRELPEELGELLAVGAGVRIERIVSRGHVSPPGFWYEQDEDEWVMVVAGAARLEIEGEGEIELRAGDWIDLPRRLRHRVAWTDPDRETIWLAVFRS